MAYGAFMPAVALTAEMPSKGIEPLIAATQSEMEKVNAHILARMGSNVALIPEVASHLINSGGKRLRPMLTLASAALVGTSGEKACILAAAVEFMHTATLLHDDVVDNSAMRRGRKSARMVWGNEASVLVGDYLLGQAFRMMVETESLSALRVLSNAAAVIAEGEVMQLDNVRALTSGEDRYFAIIKAKTAELFAAACEVGPCLAGLGAPERSALRDYGMNLGLAFQLIDDALDYSGGDSMGKNAGDDLSEGKITLPVILAYRNGNPAQQSFWEECFSGQPITAHHLREATDILHSTGALEATLERAEEYADKAREALNIFDRSEIKHALMQVIDFCVERRY